MLPIINDSEEIWKELKGFDLPYMISNKGNFKCLAYTKTDLCNRTYTKPEHILRPALNSKGYSLITLRYKCRSKSFRVNRLVAETFIPNPFNKPCVDHINGIKTDNTVSNLRWVSAKENTNNINTLEKARISWTIANKRNIKPVYQLDSNYKVIARYSSADEAAKSVGCSSVFIHRCCNISTRTAKGFHWSYSPIKLKLNKYD